MLLQQCKCQSLLLLFIKRKVFKPRAGSLGQFGTLVLLLTPHFIRRRVHELYHVKFVECDFGLRQRFLDTRDEGFGKVATDLANLVELPAGQLPVRCKLLQRRYVLSRGGEHHLRPVHVHKHRDVAMAVFARGIVNLKIFYPRKVLIAPHPPHAAV